VVARDGVSLSDDDIADAIGHEDIGRRERGQRVTELSTRTNTIRDYWGVVEMGCGHSNTSRLHEYIMTCGMNKRPSAELILIFSQLIHCRWEGLVDVDLGSSE